MKAHEQRVGTHSVRIEGDVLRMTWVGDVEAQDVTDIHACVVRMFTEYEHVFMLIDATSGRSVTLGARKRAVAWPPAHRIAGAAIYGARAANRAAATLMIAVVNFFYPKAVIPVEFTTTESAARAWVDARRRQVHSSKTPSDSRRDDGIG